MIHSYTRYFSGLFIVLAVVGCSSHHDKKDEQKTPAYIIYSPNGEPLNGGLLGRPECEKAESDWFDRLSATHNGIIPKEVFLSDAQVQFVRMDIDHNGYLVSEELDRFREPYRQQQPFLKQDAAAAQEKGHGHKGDAGGDKKSDSHPQTDSTLNDPVMSADANLDFKVTPNEFIKQAQDVFAKLDTNHDGVLDRAEVLTTCPKKQD